MSEKLEDKVELHHRALFGNPENPRDQPGVIAEQTTMRFEQKRTNEILSEVRDALKWCLGIIVSGFVVAVASLVYKIV